MLSLLPAHHQDYEFIFSVEPTYACEYSEWFAWMQQPHWANYIVTKDAEPVGCLLLERVAPSVCEFHYSTLRRRVTPSESARLLIETGKALFAGGIELLQTVIASWNRAAIRLAVACGFKFDTYVIRDKQPMMRHILPRAIYEAQPEKWGG